jgi:hypothetical protein
MDVLLTRIKCVWYITLNILSLGTRVVNYLFGRFTPIEQPPLPPLPPPDCYGIDACMDPRLGIL